MKDVKLKTWLKNLGDRLERIETALESADIDLPTKEAEAVLSEPDDDWAERWEKDGTKSKLTGLIVAPGNVTKAIAGDIGTEVDGKMYLTYDEAMELETKLPDGWRLPTRSEWVLLCEEFGQDENGELNGDVLAKNLDLSQNGWLSEDGDSLSVGLLGYYWSSSIKDSSFAYNLNFNSFSAATDNVYKRVGRSVRLVKEDK